MNLRSLVIKSNLVTASCIGYGLLVASASGAVVNEGYRFMAADGAADDEFGCAVDISHGIIAVGARNDDDNGVNSGSAYLIDASTGSQIAKLLPSDGAAGDQFGYSIAIQNGVVVVGSPGDVHNGVASGSAYLFDATTGVQLGKLVPNDPEAGDEFGNSIAIDNGIVAVGAWRADDLGDGSGAAYLFDASNGNQLEKLLPDEGNNFQTFGVSIAIDDGIVAVGSRTFFVLGEGFTFAKVHLFDSSTGDVTNVLQANIENFNGDQGGMFGDSVDINDGLVAVGAPSRSVFFDFSGAVYVFDASNGNQLQFIYPADGHDRDHFGRSVSLDNDGMLVIGADEDDDSAWSGGSAYLYEATSATQVDKLLASDGAAFDMFGTSVAIDNGVIAVGATGFSTSSFQGAVYVFGETLENCAADFTNDGLLDFFDISAFLDAFVNADPSADLTGEGQYDFFDVSAFIDVFSAGCP
ncbi:MAG: FG-GAP repeat protein [Phycisphaerales bacterium]|nr:FG-GAP repeat protein [Phycisphaerales bacterium]